MAITPERAKVLGQYLPEPAPQGGSPAPSGSAIAPERAKYLTSLLDGGASDVTPQAGPQAGPAQPSLISPDRASQLSKYLPIESPALPDKTAALVVPGYEAPERQTGVLPEVDKAEMRPGRRLGREIEQRPAAEVETATGGTEALSVVPEVAAGQMAVEAERRPVAGQMLRAGRRGPIGAWVNAAFQAVDPDSVPAKRFKAEYDAEQRGELPSPSIFKRPDLWLGSSAASLAQYAPFFAVFQNPIASFTAAEAFKQIGDVAAGMPGGFKPQSLATAALAGLVMRFGVPKSWASKMGLTPQMTAKAGGAFQRFGKELGPLAIKAGELTAINTTMRGMLGAMSGDDDAFKKAMKDAPQDMIETLAFFTAFHLVSTQGKGILAGRVESQIRKTAGPDVPQERISELANQIAYGGPKNKYQAFRGLVKVFSKANSEKLQNLGKSLAQEARAKAWSEAQQQPTAQQPSLIEPGAGVPQAPEGAGVAQPPPIPQQGPAPAPGAGVAPELQRTRSTLVNSLANAARQRRAEGRILRTKYPVGMVKEFGRLSEAEDQGGISRLVEGQRQSQRRKAVQDLDQQVRDMPLDDLTAARRFIEGVGQPQEEAPVAPPAGQKRLKAIAKGQAAEPSPIEAPPVAEGDNLSQQEQEALRGTRTAQGVSVQPPAPESPASLEPSPTVEAPVVPETPDIAALVEARSPLTTEQAQAATTAGVMVPGYQWDTEGEQFVYAAEPEAVPAPSDAAVPAPAEVEAPPPVESGKPVEQMTPDEYHAHRIARDKKPDTVDSEIKSTQEQGQDLWIALEARSPVNAVSAEALQDTTGPDFQAEGWTREGDLYVPPKGEAATTAPGTDGYLSEQIAYGGEVRSRGSIIAEMQAAGTPQKQIDAYMMGSEIAAQRSKSPPVEQAATGASEVPADTRAPPPPSPEASTRKGTLKSETEPTDNTPPGRGGVGEPPAQPQGQQRLKRPSRQPSDVTEQVEGVISEVMRLRSAGQQENKLKRKGQARPRYAAVAKNLGIEAGVVRDAVERARGVEGPRQNVGAAVEEALGIAPNQRVYKAVAVEPKQDDAPTPPQAPQVEDAEAEQTPEGQTVTSPAGEAKAAKTGGLTPKEQKKYLLAEIETAIAEAPDALPDDDAITGRITEIEGEAKAAQDEIKSAGDNPDLASMKQRREASQTIDRLKRERLDLYGTVTIEVPGDGTFEIINTKQVLRTFQKQAKKFPISVSGQDARRSSTAAKAVVAVASKRPSRQPDMEKLLAPMLSTDDTRQVLQQTHVNGKTKEIVATDGHRVAVILDSPGKTTEHMVSPREPNGVPTGGKKESATYPNYAQIVPGGRPGKMPKPTEYESAVVDSEALAHKLNRAIMAGKKQFKDDVGADSPFVTLYQMPNGDIEVSTAHPEVGGHESAEVARGNALGTLDSGYVLDAVTFLRKLGNSEVGVSWQDDVSPFLFTGKREYQVIMPVRIDSSGKLVRTVEELDAKPSEPSGKQRLKRNAPKQEKQGGAEPRFSPAAPTPTPGTDTEQLDASKYADLLESAEGVRRPKTLYRGFSEMTGQRSAGEGFGLYTTGDKAEAAGYGDVQEMPIASMPQNPAHFRNYGEFKDFLSRSSSRLGVRHVSDVVRDPAQLLIAAGYDGAMFGSGADASFVKYGAIRAVDTEQLDVLERRVENVRRRRDEVLTQEQQAEPATGRRAYSRAIARRQRTRNAVGAAAKRLDRLGKAIRVALPEAEVDQAYYTTPHGRQWLDRADKLGRTIVFYRGAKSGRDSAVLGDAVYINTDGSQDDITRRLDHELGHQAFDAKDASVRGIYDGVDRASPIVQQYRETYETLSEIPIDQERAAEEITMEVLSGRLRFAGMQMLEAFEDAGAVVELVEAYHSEGEAQSGLTAETIEDVGTGPQTSLVSARGPPGARFAPRGPTDVGRLRQQAAELGVPEHQADMMRDLYQSIIGVRAIASDTNASWQEQAQAIKAFAGQHLRGTERAKVMGILSGSKSGAARQQIIRAMQIVNGAHQRMVRRREEEALTSVAPQLSKIQSTALMSQMREMIRNERNDIADVQAGLRRYAARMLSPEADVRRLLPRVDQLARFAKPKTREKYRILAMDLIDKIQMEHEARKQRERVMGIIATENVRLRRSVGRGKKSGMPAEYAQSLREYIDSISVQGPRIRDRVQELLREIENDPNRELPASMLQEAAELAKPNINDMTLEQLQNVENTIKNIRETGRTLWEEAAEEESSDIEFAAESAAEVMHAASGTDREPPMKRSLRISRGRQNNLKRQGQKLKKYGVGWMRPERAAWWFEGYHPSRAFYNETFDRTLKAEEAEARAKEQTLERMRSLTDGLNMYEATHKPASKITTVDGSEYELYLTEMMAIYALGQSEGGMGHLAGMGITEEIVSDIGDTLPVRAMEIVHDWFRYASAEQYDRINQVFRREHGIDMPKVDNYFPIQDVETDRAQNALVVDMLKRLGSGSASVSKGFTMERVESKAPVRGLDFFVAIARSMKDSERYIAWNDTVRRVSRFLRQPIVRDAMMARAEASKIPGATAIVDDFNEWLKTTAHGRLAGPTQGIDALSDALRLNVVPAILAGNVTSILIQPASMVTGMRRMSHPAEVGVSLSRMLSSYSEFRDGIFSRSTMMRHRGESFEREQAELMEQSEVKRLAEGAPSIGDKLRRVRKGGLSAVKEVVPSWNEVRRWAMTGQRVFDKVTTMLLWDGEFRSQLDAHINDENAEDLAVKAADELIRTTQPMGGLMHLPPFMRTRGVLRAFTAFRNQINQNFNLGFESFANYRGAASTSLDMLFFFVVTGMLVSLIRNAGRPPKTPREFSDAITDQWAGAFPVTDIVLKGASAAVFGKSSSDWYKADITPVSFRPIEDLAKAGFYRSPGKLLDAGGGFLPGYTQMKRTYKGIEPFSETGDPRYLFWSKYAVDGPRRGAGRLKRRNRASGVVKPVESVQGH